MLTRDDLTVPDCLEVLEAVRPLRPRHVGFKDLGVPLAVQHELVARIRAMGATCYLEVVSESPEACLRSTESAVALGVDRLLGGTDIAAMGAIVAGSGIALYPFCGRPQGHPTRLSGRAEEIASHCRALVDAGAQGVDLLAYRAVDDDPLAIVAAARRALGDGRLIVAGSIDSPDRIRQLADLGVDAITMGTALFEDAFAPDRRGVAAQLEAALAALPQSRSRSDEIDPNS